MTTTITLATRDCIVLGCDSLATSIQPMLDPIRFTDHFFESDGSIKLDSQSKSELKTAKQLYAFVTYVPKDQLPNVTKMYNFKGYKAGAIFAGASVIGSYSTKNIVDSFLDWKGSPSSPDTQTPISLLAEEFFTYVKRIYDEAYDSFSEQFKPISVVVLSGYSHGSLQPEVFRLTFSSHPSLKSEVETGKYGIVFSGQYDVIERVVNGIDFSSYISLSDRFNNILLYYRDQANEFLRQKGIKLELPPLDSTDTKLKPFHGDFGGIKGLNSDHASLSEQAAINFVEFLVDTMVKAQQFSGTIPTVGGDVHIAIITSAGGFRWISKEEYLFHGHSVPKHSNS